LAGLIHWRRHNSGGVIPKRESDGDAGAVTGGGAKRTTLTATASRIMESAVTPLMVALYGIIITEGIFRYRVTDSPAFTPADAGIGLPLGCAESFPACFARLCAFFFRQWR
jgi:hypothetical protein